MADKDSMERKVFLLPAELVARLKVYQAESGIASEVEAVRRLLDTALQMRDSVETILDKLEARFEDEKDLRILATEVLTRHPLVTTVTFEDAEVSFYLKDGHSGTINHKGDLFLGYPDTGPNDRQSYKHIREQRLFNSAGKPKPKLKPTTLDDEIPF